MPEGTTDYYASALGWSSFNYIIDDIAIVAAETVEISAETIELKIGETYQLSATVYPENTTDKSLTWSSSNEEIVTVSETGLVTAVSEGFAYITVTCGNVFGSCLITVTNDTGIDSLLANPESKIYIYSTNGILIRKDCKIEDLKSLSHGIYIIVSGKERYKITI